MQESRAPLAGQPHAQKASPQNALCAAQLGYSWHPRSSRRGHTAGWGQRHEGKTALQDGPKTKETALQAGGHVATWSHQGEAGVGHRGCLGQPRGAGEGANGRGGQIPLETEALHFRKGFAEEENITQNHPFISENQISLPSHQENTQTESMHSFYQFQIYLCRILNVLSRGKGRNWGAVLVGRACWSGRETCAQMASGQVPRRDRVGDAAHPREWPCSGLGGSSLQPLGTSPGHPRCECIKPLWDRRPQGHLLQSFPCKARVNSYRAVGQSLFSPSCVRTTPWKIYKPSHACTLKRGWGLRALVLVHFMSSGAL